MKLDLVSLGCAAIVAGTAVVLAASASAEPLHVLIVHADQHRIDCLGAYGNKEIKTPHIDSLAADGVRFNNSFCTFPVCTPSRYSLLSGLPVHEHQGWDNHCTLSPGTPTFASVLRQAGYATKAVGKMHFSPTYLDVGFAEMELAEQDGPGRWDDDYHRYLRQFGLVDANDLEDQRSEYRRGARQIYWDSFGALPSNLQEKDYSTTWIADRAMETLQKWTPEQPALLMVGFIKPHHPFDPPEPWAHRYDLEKISLLPGWTTRMFPYDVRGYFTNANLTEAAVRRCTALYYASISEIDEQIGRMLALLKSKGLYRNTLIIFTSDHGEYLGFHHQLLKSGQMYDPLVKVPLIVKLPGNREAGSVTDKLVSNIDVGPTVLKIAGCKLAPGMKGLDLTDPAAVREIVFCETADTVMARTQTRKLLYNTRNPARSLLFDVQHDPLEMTNAYAVPAFKKDVAVLVEAIQTWRPNRPGRAFLDENAPQIRQPNVPANTQAHRQEMIDYYARKMKESSAFGSGVR
jgi:arylsulfatase